MPSKATVFRVMIASPSDVKEERKIAQEVIAEWNAVHSSDKNIVLLPLLWERDSTPAYGTRPQELINNEVLEKADVLVAIFWTRIGTSTGSHISGTVEEFSRHIASQKPTLLYFSLAPVLPDQIDQEQLALLRHFQKEAQAKNLYGTFKSTDHFRQEFTRHLAKLVVDHSIFACIDEENFAEQSVSEFDFEPTLMRKSLSREATILLKEATEDVSARITRIRFGGGNMVGTNRKNFVANDTPREMAKWEGAVNELHELGFIEAVGVKNEIFRVTNAGFEFADSIIKDW